MQNEQRDPEPMEGVTPPRESEGTGEPMEGVEVREGETAEISAGDPKPWDRGPLVASFMGGIHLRAKAGEAPAVPTINAVEKVIRDALDLAGYAATVDLTRTDR